MQELLVPTDSCVEVESDKRHLTISTNNHSFHESLQQAFLAREAVKVGLDLPANHGTVFYQVHLMQQTLHSRPHIPENINFSGLYLFEYYAFIEESYVSLS